MNGERTGTAKLKRLLSDHPSLRSGQALGSQAYTVSYDGVSEEGEVRYRARCEECFTALPVVINRGSTDSAAL